MIETNIFKESFKNTFSQLSDFPRDDILGAADADAEVFSELLSINLMKLEKVSSCSFKFEVCYTHFALRVLITLSSTHPFVSAGNHTEQASFQRAKCN